MIYSVIVCIVFFAAAAMCITRFLSEAGVKLPDNRVLKFITADKQPKPAGEAVTRKECLYVFLGALAFRVVILLAGWLAYGIFQYESVPNFLEYCGKWNLWDAPHYIEIAQNGYAAHIEDGKYLFLVFFPLYPFLMRIFHFVIRNWELAGLAVSFVCYSVGCALTYKLVTIDYSKAIARMSVIFLSIYPFAFFHGGIMTEGLFFMLTIATFLAIRKHKWWIAGVLGALTALTRSFGVFMIIPAAIEWAQSEAPIRLMLNKDWRTLGKRIVEVLPILIMPIGTLIYLYINYSVAGDPFIFLEYLSEHWSQKLQFFGKTINMLWSRTFSSTEYWTFIVCMFLPELLSVLPLAGVILYSNGRTRTMYTAFMLIYFAFNAGASWPLSLPRYLSCMFPMFWVMAGFTNRHKWLETPIAVVMAIAFGIYLTAYITCHNLM